MKIMEPKTPYVRYNAETDEVMDLDSALPSSPFFLSPLTPNHRDPRLRARQSRGDGGGYRLPYERGDAPFPREEQWVLECRRVQEGQRGEREDGQGRGTGSEFGRGGR